jgi:outer membrane protein TolC
MNTDLRIGALLLLASTLFLSASDARAQNSSASANTNETQQAEIYPIDLPTVLRLANAQNLDVQIARQRLAEAKATYEGAVLQFFPWLSPGVTYRRHENLIQDVAGNMFNVNKELYAPGLTLTAQVDVGDALYKSLSARQSLRAAGQGVEAQRQDSILAAIQGYFDLAKAQAEVGVAKEARKISQDLERQLGHAVAAGIAYKGDELRVKVQTGQTELALRRVMEEQRIAAVRLADVLHLDSAVELLAKETELVPLALVATNAALSPLVEQALAKRAELRQSLALLSAANSARQGAAYGPLIPSVGGQAFIGGLGGGRDNTPSVFGESEDYAAFLSWRVGPGGLFDSSRTHLAKSRLEVVRLSNEKLHDSITSEVVANLTRFRSLVDQLATTKRNLEIAIDAQKLAEQRKEFAVGIVLEDIQTQQDLTRARNDFVTIVAEYNKVQYALQRAIGNPLFETGSPGR